MANIISVITSNTVPGPKRVSSTSPTLYVLLLDGDPRIGTGCECPLSSIGVYVDNTSFPVRAFQYFKYGKGNTDWVLVADETGGGGGALPAPPGTDGSVLVEDSGIYIQRRLRESDIDPDFQISGFSLAGGSLIEVGDTLTNPAFTASYSLTPDSVTIVDNQGGSIVSLSSPFTSFFYTGSYTESTYNATVSFTLSATEGESTDNSNVTKRWVQRVFWGVGVDGLSSEADIEGLSNNALATSRSRNFTLNPGVGEHIYYAYRSAFGDATFTVGGFEGGFELVSDSISVTNAFGFTENYRLYKSTNPNLGSTTVSVS
jgi:hypothetical protein